MISRSRKYDTYRAQRKTEKRLAKDEEWQRKVQEFRRLNAARLPGAPK